MLLVLLFQNSRTRSLSNESSIYSAKATAINLAKNIANHRCSKFIIYSKLVLLALPNKDRLTQQNGYFSKIMASLSPEYQIHGNERTDSCKKDISLLTIQKSHTLILKPTINKFMCDKWQVPPYKRYHQ